MVDLDAADLEQSWTGAAGCSSSAGLPEDVSSQLVLRKERKGRANLGDMRKERVPSLWNPGEAS